MFICLYRTNNTASYWQIQFKARMKRDPARNLESTACKLQHITLHVDKVYASTTWKVQDNVCHFDVNWQCHRLQMLSAMLIAIIILTTVMTLLILKQFLISEQHKSNQERDSQRTCNLSHTKYIIANRIYHILCIQKIQCACVIRRKKTRLHNLYDNRLEHTSCFYQSWVYTLLPSLHLCII